jgi:hypothetical protein
VWRACVCVSRGRVHVYVFACSVLALCVMHQATPAVHPEALSKVRPSSDLHATKLQEAASLVGTIVPPHVSALATFQ